MKAAPIICVLMLIAACCIAGCASSSTDEEKGQEPVTTGATGSGDSGPSADLSAGEEQRPEAGSVKAVGYQELITYLPAAPSGWTAEEPFGITNQIDEGTWSMATLSYCNDANEETTAELVIYDSAYYAVGGWEFWESKFSYETTDGYLKSGEVQGYPSWESYEKDLQTYAKWVGIDDRFMVYVSIDAGSKADLDTFVNAIDYKGIASLR
ncbi:hypothetical protein RJ40_02635 [Methanofollis aquaemaris]|uniref:Uncharacterized protein n=1 Tax=Methanofollis aquaemaris TaxID=126734 RepID=A0A8A3S336_9EURY|nr:hypothetical protein [Methanofollis aquaemaris]QSZ66472.1 hypothetical protein RJ40_02635 [Methanofollis aquaemaris]